MFSLPVLLYIMPMKILSLFLTLILFSATAQAQTPERHVQLRLMPERTAVKGGETILIGIEQAIVPDWHTYWANPGDSGESMRITWDLPDGFRVSVLRWPLPERIKIGPLVSFGFKDRVLPVQKLTLPETLPDGPLVLTAKTETLVCDEICIPENDTLTLTLNDGNVTDNRSVLSEAMAEIPEESATITDASYREENGKFELTLNVPPPGKVVDAFPYDWGLMVNEGRPELALKDNHLVVRHPRGERPLSDVEAVRVLLIYTDSAGNRKGIDVEAKPDLLPAAQKKTTETTPLTLYAALLLAFLGGMVLNLMPCVFPVLSMKALSLMKMSAKGDAHARLYGLTYTAGILVCFTLVAGTLIALQASGSQIGWGFQLQNPLVVLLLSWLLFTVGLNFSGMFEIGGSFTNVGANLAGREGLKGSFFTGMLAAIVATPCTAPFMGAAIGYALVQPPASALAVFLALGFGLAFPYLLICFLPPVRRLLPKPGHWMQTLREFLAFPMYASAAWLSWVYAMQAGPNGILSALSGMILLAMIFWLAARMPERGAGRALSVLLAVLLISGLGALSWTAVRAHASVAVVETGEAEAFTPQRFDKLLRGDKPVFVNMTAAWCITCKINERTALSSHEVKMLFQDQGIHYLKGDWTSRNADITAFLARYGRNGVPLYIYYGAPDRHGQRPEPVVLPQILTPSIVRNALTPTERTEP